MISLQGSLRDCKVYQQMAPRLLSDRFENPNNMMCPVWSGRDTVGRPVAPDSFITKQAGCNTPMDRVYVENALRPEYMEQSTTDAYGFRSDIYQGQKASMPITEYANYYSLAKKIAPDMPPSPYTRCSFYPYDTNQRQDAIIADYSRHAQNIQHLAKSNEFLQLSGFNE